MPCFVIFARFVGNYSQHECGLGFSVQPGHRGDWICELEKYHVGFNKRLMEPKQRTQKLTRNLEKQYFRYGEVRYGQITLSVLSFRFDICSNKTYLQSVKYPQQKHPVPGVVLLGRGVWTLWTHWEHLTADGGSELQLCQESISEISGKNLKN